ncbi:hypothetical protein CFC21_093865 [Triticum aestivum]|uniref:Uncharacterized protein n=2 Tax=Triticum aestivum TaxID=4565 RepID=A0A9R1LLW6_WHEAT|nr:uncharacterized protein LOC123145643 [Triticum aestivum]KAF7091248.1 hypothetical protein CFC21_093865 [Triticum aestivum]
MSTSSGKPLLVVIRRSKLSAGGEGRRVCTEFKQAKYPFKWRRYMCARCGVLRDEHRASKSKVSTGDEGDHIKGKSKLCGDEGEHIAGKNKLSAGDEGEQIACKSKHSAGDGGEHDTDKSKLFAGDKGEHSADKCKLSAEDEGERSANKTKISAREKGERVCTEFKQAKYPFKWRKYMCARCGVHRSEHGVSKAKAKVDDDMENVREELLPPRKRLILRFKRSQALAAAAVAASREKENKEGELEEGEITWSPGSTITKGKRAPRRKP